MILEHCNVFLGFDMFQLSIIAPSNNINLIIELLMAWLVDVSITQNIATSCFNHPKHGHYMFQSPETWLLHGSIAWNMVTTLGLMKYKFECSTLMSTINHYVSYVCFNYVCYVHVNIIFACEVWYKLKMVMKLLL